MEKIKKLTENLGAISFELRESFLSGYYTPKGWAEIKRIRAETLRVELLVAEIKKDTAQKILELQTLILEENKKATGQADGDLSVDRILN